MDQLDRISHMEEIMERAETLFPVLKEVLGQYQQLVPELDELENYYSSNDWREDYDADEAGKLPAYLKRGVLSEDGIWNLLVDRDSLLYQIQKLGEHDQQEEHTESDSDLTE